MALAREYLYKAVTLISLCLLKMLVIGKVLLSVATKEEPTAKLPILETIRGY